ncbi:hypothetical protein VKT23_015971 [Stygiomarasmius scandens]|uniref:Uncharacterized protein n=1 Tax=Marasmiellus scandens TaxID=2682957 RepID=A0ABR1IW93_9AGAR
MSTSTPTHIKVAKPIVASSKSFYPVRLGGVAATIAVSITQSSSVYKPPGIASLKTVGTAGASSSLMVSVLVPYYSDRRPRSLRWHYQNVDALDAIAKMPHSDRHYEPPPYSQQDPISTLDDPLTLRKPRNDAWNVRSFSLRHFQGGIAKDQLFRGHHCVVTSLL